MLNVSNLSIRYGEFVAVAGVSLSVNQGEFVSILGPSGCGKTTLLRAIAGFVYPDSGEIVLDGKSITYATPQERRIGMVFQNYALFPHMTVAENIGFALSIERRSRNEIKTRVAEMLAIVKLEGFEARRPEELSGGQQQRVALARALAFSPQLLLLDEPLAALDLRLREAMQMEIRRIQRDTGVTAIFVTHDQGEALAMSDRVAVMNAGRIEQFDTPRAIYTAPQTTFVAQFVGKSNIVDALVTAVRNDVVEVSVAGTSMQLPRTNTGPLPAIGGACRFSIRPEHLRVSRIATASAIAATVHGVLFLGTHQLLELHTPVGTLLAHAVAPWSTGDQAYVEWDAANARLLSD
jgi:ABC-type Fe3+/spermidine/putrescine transport system ATPase subunit